LKNSNLAKGGEKGKTCGKVLKNDEKSKQKVAKICLEVTKS
jgi:hypothetical protein